MKRGFLNLFGLAALMSGGMDVNKGVFHDNKTTRSGNYRGNRPSVSGLTKKQKKARVRSKMAKQSRKINYKKAK